MTVKASYLKFGPDLTVLNRDTGHGDSVAQLRGVSRAGDHADLFAAGKNGVAVGRSFLPVEQQADEFAAGMGCVALKGRAANEGLFLEVHRKAKARFHRVYIRSEFRPRDHQPRLFPAHVQGRPAHRDQTQRRACLHQTVPNRRRIVAVAEHLVPQLTGEARAEGAFYLVGNIEEVKAKAEKIAAETK